MDGALSLLVGGDLLLIGFLYILYIDWGRYWGNPCLSKSLLMVEQGVVAPGYLIMVKQRAGVQRVLGQQSEIRALYWGTHHRTSTFWVAIRKAVSLHGTDQTQDIIAHWSKPPKYIFLSQQNLMNAKIIADLVIWGASCTLVLCCAISCKFSLLKDFLLHS